MAAWETSRDYTTRHCIFTIDSADDLWMLPTSKTVGQGDLIRSTTCRMGSLAKVTSDGSAYILTGADKWISYVDKSSGGGGSGPDDYDYIDDSDIEDLFDNDDLQSGGASGGNSGQGDSGGIDASDLPDDVEFISDDEINSLFGGN